MTFFFFFFFFFKFTVASGAATGVAAARTGDRRERARRHRRARSKRSVAWAASDCRIGRRFGRSENWSERIRGCIRRAADAVSLAGLIADAHRYRVRECSSTRDGMLTVVGGVPQRWLGASDDVTVRGSSALDSRHPTLTRDTRLLALVAPVVSFPVLPRSALPLSPAAAAVPSDVAGAGRRRRLDLRANNLAAPLKDAPQAAAELGVLAESLGDQMADARQHLFDRVQLLIGRDERRRAGLHVGRFGPGFIDFDRQRLQAAARGRSWPASASSA